jgi:hypothetical protein
LGLTLLLAGCGPASDITAAPTVGTGTGPLRVLSPANGSTIDTPTVLVQGSAPIGVTVTQDVDLAADPQTIADASGQWTMSVTLDAGANKLTFRLGDDASTDVALYLTSTAGVPSATDTAAASDDPTDEPTAAPPTAAPTSVATAPFTYKASGTHKSSPFTIALPARIDYTFSGSGDFIASVESTDGSGSVGEIANITGADTATTWVYGDGERARVYLDVIANGSYTIKVTSAATPAVQDLPASYSGASGRTTAPFSASGDVTIRYSHTGGGNFLVDIVDASTGELGDSVANEIGEVASETSVSGLDGRYAFAVVADGPWTLAVSIQ